MRSGVFQPRRMKQELDLREDAAFDHEVPLSEAAVEVLRVVRTFSSGTGPIFPGGRDMMSPLSENAVGYLYNREGWKDRHVPHGWRSSFSTMPPGATKACLRALLPARRLFSAPIDRARRNRRRDRGEADAGRARLAPASLAKHIADPGHVVRCPPTREPGGSFAAVIGAGLGEAEPHSRSIRGWSHIARVT
jgi:hypothetical protein